MQIAAPSRTVATVPTVSIALRGRERMLGAQCRPLRRYATVAQHRTP